MGAADAQVRKDLGIIGHSGVPGIGYRVGALAEAIREVIGVHKQWRAALVGAGNIGRALAAYRSFHQQGFEIVAVFDASAAVVGRTVAQLRVRPMSDWPPRWRVKTLVLESLPCHLNLRKRWLTI